MKPSSFYNLVALRNRLQKISKNVHRLPLSPRRYRILSSQLDAVFKALEHVALEGRPPNIFAKVQANSLITQCCSLYRQLEEGLAHRKLHQIQQESVAIRRGNLSSKAIKALEFHLKTLLKEYAPSIEEKWILLEATRTIKTAKKHLSQGTTPSQSEWLAITPSPTVSHFFLSYEAQELYALGQAVYERNLSLARMRYHCFSQSIKIQVEKHLVRLNSQIFEDLTKTIQALIATAEGLVGNSQDYLSIEEMNQLYAGITYAEIAPNTTNIQI